LTKNLQTNHEIMIPNRKLVWNQNAENTQISWKKFKRFFLGIWVFFYPFLRSNCFSRARQLCALFPRLGKKYPNTQIPGVFRQLCSLPNFLYIFTAPANEQFFVKDALSPKSRKYKCVLLLWLLYRQLINWINLIAFIGFCYL